MNQSKMKPNSAFERTVDQRACVYRQCLAAQRGR
jgi:hypothetical protein